MHTDANRYYAMLGVLPESSEAAIRAAFRRRAKELHPDFESGSAGAFIRLKRAYDTLSDAASRAEYDHACSQQPRPAQAADVRPPPPPPPRPARRRGGIGFLRYATAFVFMSALSFGFIEAMISWTEAPSATPAFRREPELAGPRAKSPADEPAPARSSEAADTQPGFWKGEPLPTPADEARPQRPQRPPPAGRLGATPGR